MDREDSSLIKWKATHPSPRVDNNEIVKLYWKHLKLFFLITTGQISTKLVQFKYVQMMGHTPLKGEILAKLQNYFPRCMMCPMGLLILAHLSCQSSIELFWSPVVRLLSFCPPVCKFSQEPLGQFQPNLTKNPWVKGIQVFFNWRTIPYPKGEIIWK